MGTPPNDPKTGRPLQGDDKRADFERISQQTPPAHATSRAFIEGKIEMVLADSRLSEEEKKKAIAELRALIK